MTKSVIMEPFCLRAGATDNGEEEPDRWNKFQVEVKKRAEKARKVADKYQLPFITLQVLYPQGFALYCNLCYHINNYVEK